MKTSCTIIMRPTIKRPELGNLYFNTSGRLFVSEEGKTGGGKNTQNLFVLSDDKIQNNDSVFNFEKNALFKIKSICPHQAYDLETLEGKFIDSNDCKKIIASTTFFGLKLSQSFLKHYVFEYNNGTVLRSLNIEYISGTINLYKETVPLNCKLLYFDEHGNYRGIRVDEKGCLYVEIEKVSYTKEEVIAFGLKCVELGMDLEKSPLPRLTNISGKEFYLNWIKENL